MCAHQPVLTFGIKAILLHDRANCPSPSYRNETIPSFIMSFSYPPSCSENAYPSMLTNSSNGDRRVAQRGWRPSSFVSNLGTSLMSKDAAYTSFQRSHSGGSLEGLDSSTSTVVRMSQDVMSQQGSALADDESFIRRRSEGEPPKEWRMLFIFDVIQDLMGRMRHYHCRMRQALWLRLIEGDVDDDVWLRSEKPYWHSWYDWELTQRDGCLSEPYDKSLPNGGRYNLLIPLGSFADVLSFCGGWD
ncbi:hypothetical protein F5J12DRAFT_928543 [Pisolithus orientalis]|uniref:uncharacterized protein n=1 Tax=Pisolithus orientalis TaxID=936130 RepID=UPI0022258C9F|nr:uncharacterized protein F5J12DRAFT_928543 [Pisolithus orientalis]KAI6000354.1 hypothetical protein F5J12DRAFT_928543 [Pisolithus orientalis]